MGRLPCTVTAWEAVHATMRGYAAGVDWASLYSSVAAASVDHRRSAMT